MAASEQDVLSALSNIGNPQSSEESLDYARQILSQYQMGMPGPEEEALEALREQQMDVRGALERARERIMELRGPSRAEKWLALGRGLGQTTKAGSIGETASNVAAQMQPLAARQTAFDAGQASSLSDLDLALAQVNAPVTAAEFDIAKMQFEQQGRMAQEALKTIRGAGTSSGGRTREPKIQDLMRLHNWSRADAAALVDGFVGIEMVPELGVGRLVNEISGTVTEIPLEQIDEFMGYFPDDDQSRPSNVPGDSRESAASDYRTDIEKMADDIVMQRIDEGTSLWDMAGVSTGPWAQARVGASYLTSLFGADTWVATKTIEGRQGLKLRSRDLARVLIDNPRMPVKLIEMAIEEAALEDSVIDTPQLMQTRLVALDRELWDRYLDAAEGAQDPGIDPTERADMKQNARYLAIFLRDLRVPVERQKRRTRVLPDGTMIGDESEAETVDKYATPPPGWTGTELQWKLVPPEKKFHWDAFYEVEGVDF